MRNEHQTRKDESEQLQRRFNKEIDGLMANEQKLSEKRSLLNNELRKTKKRLLSLHVEHNRLNGRHEELSEKYSSVLKEKSKLIDENTTLQNKINVLEEEQRKLNVNIESLNGGIQEYKDKVHRLEAQQ